LSFGSFFYGLGNGSNVRGIGGHALSPGDAVRCAQGADRVMAMVIGRFDRGGRGIGRGSDGDADRGGGLLEARLQLAMSSLPPVPETFERMEIRF
jgi:hypothetical protein